jgi:transcription elongation factor Elf1
MGMFDTVKFNCPQCGADQSIQSKAGPCWMEQFTVHDAPEEVMRDLFQQHVACSNCNTVISFAVSNAPRLMPYYHL